MKSNYKRDANSFRSAIDKAKRKFSSRDKMYNFPTGCCDDATDLFAHYLFQNYGLTTTRVDGSYYDENPENNDWHTWLEVDGIIYDLTANLYYENIKVYVGKYDSFHSRYEQRRLVYHGFQDLGDDCQERMQNIYQLIVNHMSRRN